MMIVTKEFTGLYQFLTKIYTLFSKEGSNCILFKNDQNELCYATTQVAGKIKIMHGDVICLSELVEGKFYEVVKITCGGFRLNIAKYEEEEEREHKETKHRVEHLFSKFGDLSCEINTNDYCVVSKITRLTKHYIKDSHVKLIEKFGSCIVNALNECIILEKEFEKKGFVVIESMLLSSKSYEDVDANTQGRMELDA